MARFGLPRLDGDTPTYLSDLLLGGWRLRERTGLRRVGDPPADGRVVLGGNWALEAHRLEAALRRSGGGHLLVVETEGRDLSSAIALDLIDAERTNRILHDPDVLALADREPPEVPPEPEPTAVPEPPESADASADVGTDPVAPEDGGDEMMAPGPGPSRRLLLPAVLAELVDAERIERELGWAVVTGPNRLVPREAQLLGGVDAATEGPPSLRERLEAAVSGAAFLTVLALVPLVLFARALSPLGIALIWLAYLMVGAAGPLLPRLPRLLVGGLAGALGGLTVALLWRAIGGQPSPLVGLNLVLAGTLLGVWAGQSHLQPGQPLRLRQLGWTFGLILAIGLVSLVTAGQ